MVEQPEQYPWSSYHANGLGIKNDLLTNHSLYLQLGNTDKQRQNHYQKLFDSVINKQDIEMIRDNTNQCAIVGNNKFEQEINQMLKRRVSKMKHGGDRKSEGFKRESSGLTP